LEIAMTLSSRKKSSGRQFASMADCPMAIRKMMSFVMFMGAKADGVCMQMDWNATKATEATEATDGMCFQRRDAVVTFVIAVSESSR
jgi:hypothetical protein